MDNLAEIFRMNNYENTLKSLVSKKSSLNSND